MGAIFAEKKDPTRRVVHPAAQTMKKGEWLS